MPIVIILIGIALIIVNYKALKKNENSFSSVYSNKKEDLTEIDLKIGQIRKDMEQWFWNVLNTLWDL